MAWLPGSSCLARMKSSDEIFFSCDTIGGRDQRRLMSSLKYLSVLHLCLQKYDLMISSDSARQEMSMLPQSVKKLLKPLVSLTCGMLNLKIALDIILQFYLTSAQWAEISSLVNRCIVVIISVGIMLVARILSAWRQCDSYYLVSTV